MVYLTFVIPVIFCLILFFLFREKTVWWEYLVVFIPSILISLLVNFIMLESNTTSTEYFGYYVKSIKHYDAWNEYIHRTCTRQVPCGTDSKGHTRYRTETYDCSYVSYHDEYWVAVDNTKDEWEISKALFDEYRTKWGTPMQFIDMKRNYHTKDGDAQAYQWNNVREDVLTLTVAHSYRNKIKGAKSVFGFQDIDDDEAEERELYKYPKTEKFGRFFAGTQNPIVGFIPDETVINKFKFINGYYGMSHQFRVYVLVYRDKSLDIVKQQRDYWFGGNKNELVICFGLDSKTNKLMWTDAFSWCDKPTMETEIRHLFSNKEYLDLDLLASKIEECLKSGKWERKSFKDYEYLSLELSTSQLIWLIVITILVNIGIGLWVILNEFKEENAD